jgi:hypothetical protein
VLLNWLSGFGAIELAGVDLLYLGSPDSLNDTEGHSFSRPVSSQTSYTSSLLLLLILLPPASSTF